MTKRDVEDYLKEGIYGKRRPKEAEREKYLGTLRERIVLILTVGQVMTDAGIEALDRAMKEHPDTKLLINGKVSHRFLTKEKEVANKHNIPYTIVSNEEVDTDIGAVLTYDYAVNIENIYLEDQKEEKEIPNKEDEQQNQHTFFSKVKNWFNRQ